jgi:hypothetical protein
VGGEVEGAASRPCPGREEEEEEEEAAGGLRQWEGEAEVEGHSMKGAAGLEVARVVH